MARCTLDRQQAMNGSLPDICMVCGRPSATKQSNRFTYTPFWMLLMNVLPTRMTWYSMTIIEMPTPLCHSHEYRMWLPFKTKMWAFGAFGIGFVLTALCAVTIVLAPAAFVILPLTIVSVFVLILTAFYFEVNTPRLVGLSQQTLKFESCSDEFAQHATPSVQGWPQPESDVANKRIALGVVGAFGGVGSLVFLVFAGCCGLVILPNVMAGFMGGNNQPRPPANQQANNQNNQPVNNQPPVVNNRQQNNNQNRVENPTDANEQNSGDNGEPVVEAFTVRSPADAVTGLNSGERDKQQKAIQWLHKNGPAVDADKNAVVAALNSYANTDYPAAAGAIRKGWFNESSIDLLLRMFEEAQGDAFKRRELHFLITNIGTIQDERLIDPLCSFVATYEVRGPAKAALMEYGPNEKIVANVQDLLLSENRDTQNIAADLMKSADAADEDYVDVAITGLQSDDRRVQHLAASLLAGVEPIEARRVEASQLLAKLAVSSDRGDREAGVKALQKWVASESVEELMPLLDSKDVFFLRRIFGIFAKTGNPMAVPKIAAHFKNFHVRQQAGAALKEYGPVAELAVAELLQDNSIDRDARGILAEIGTKRSIPAVRQAMAAAQQRNDRNRYNQLEGLLQTISQRDGEVESGSSDPPPPAEEVVAELREWTDNTGAYKIKATFLEVKNGEAQLKRESGETISLPLSKLSDADQKYIRDFLTAKRNAG